MCGHTHIRCIYIASKAAALIEALRQLQLVQLAVMSAQLGKAAVANIQQGNLQQLMHMGSIALCQLQLVKASCYVSTARVKTAVANNIIT